MKLKKLKICNFRSFQNEETIEFDEINGLIGANSTGKSSALLALCKLFSENSNERLIGKKDFFQSEIADKRNLYIEAVFEINIDTYETPLFLGHYVVDNEGADPYLRIRLEATWEEDGTVEGAIDSRVYFITCAEDEIIGDDDRMPANRNVLNKIRVIYVPALRNPNLQLKNASGSMMSRLMKGINWSTETKENIKELINNLNNVTASERGVGILQEAIKNEWQKYQSDKRYSEANLIFNSDNIESALTKAEIIFSSGGSQKSNIDDLGDGHRSLFYISMIESFLDIEDRIVKEEIEGLEKSIELSPPLLTILAVEEPENHIAPHLLGKLVKCLKSVAQKENAQVILTSHSPAIIKRIDPREIRYLRLNSDTQSTRVNRLSLPADEKLADAYKFVKEAVTAYPELYFSKLVILGEGDSEELILSKFFELSGENVDISEISVVPLGGRFVNHFWRLLTNLGIPYITLLDLDRERFGGGWGRIKYACQQLIDIGVPKEKILTCGNLPEVLTDEDFEVMHTWDVTETKKMDGWMTLLENYNIFFSSPLDIDFMMLENFGDVYKKTISKNEGPRIKKDGKSLKIIDIANDSNLKSSQEYIGKLQDSVRSTLKKEGGEGTTYSGNQKELMIWYNYFFLGRGKPTTHLSMFSQVEDEKLKASTPEVIEKIMNRTNNLLSGES
jgi:putative ATP-dependent endonuclease of the OLD family